MAELAGKAGKAVREGLEVLAARVAVARDCAGGATAGSRDSRARSVRQGATGLQDSAERSNEVGVKPGYKD